MLDVFVVVILVGMVRFGAFASVRPEAGLLAFGAVVIATMLAAASFDPRLIWPEDDEAPAPAQSRRWWRRPSQRQSRRNAVVAGSARDARRAGLSTP